MKKHATQDKLQKGDHVDAPSHGIYGATVTAIFRGIARLRVYHPIERAILRRIPARDCVKAHQ